MTQRRRALIVGGGVIGVTSAYYLSERNWDVTLIEKDSIGGGCSHGNCGLICPSDVLPLASPGAIRKTLAAMCRGRSPLYIKPRLTPRLWSWLLKFALRCNPRDMIRSANGRMALLEPSMLMYQQLFDRLEIDCEWQHRGLLYVFQSLKGLDAYSSTDETLSEEFGLIARRLESQELHSLDPSLKDSVAGAWYYEDDGHLRPDRLMSEWKRILTEAGVQIHENTEMQALDVRRGTVVSAETSSGDFDADAVLVATGAVTNTNGLLILSSVNVYFLSWFPLFPSSFHMFLKKFTHRFCTHHTIITLYEIMSFNTTSSSFVLIHFIPLFYGIPCIFPITPIIKNIWCWY